MPIAGKLIVHRLIEEIQQLCQAPIHHIGFIVKDLPPLTKAQLTAMATALGAEAHFYEQTEALGTAHAIACAAPLLQGPTLVAFADTLFKNHHPLNIDQEGIICVKQVEDPSAFGVVQTDARGMIIDFVEKPTQFVSDLAIIGIYYFKHGEALLQAIRHIIQQKHHHQGEYQLTSALKHMQQTGYAFSPQTVDTWLDCGNKSACLNANHFFLTHLQQSQQDTVAKSATIQNSTLIPPVYIGEQVVIENTVLGPYVSVGNHTRITNTHITHSILQEYAVIHQAHLTNSIIGHHVQLIGRSSAVDVGDYNHIDL
eukprot:gene2988-3731_t